MNHVFVQTVAERMHLNGEKAREALKRRTLFFLCEQSKNFIHHSLCNACGLRWAKANKS